MQLQVALTGSIGSGKSTVATMLGTYGACIVSGDQLGRNVLEQDINVRDSLVAKLGSRILNANGELNRNEIAKVVFSDKALAKWLTDLTFPGIYAQWKVLAANSKCGVNVFDAALIFEWGIESDFDVIIVVTANRDLAIKRSMSRFTISDFDLRSSNQLPIEHKLAQADIVIYNNGTRQELQQQVDRVWTTHITPLLA